MALNFNDVLNKPAAEIERPPLPPVGTYKWSVSKLPEQRTTPDEKWDIVEFPFKCVGWEDDVDPDEYKGNLMGIPQRLTFMFDKEDEAKFEQTLFRLKTFLVKHLGLEEASVKEMLNASVNAQCLGTISYRQDKNDPEVFYAQIGRTAPLD